MTKQEYINFSLDKGLKGLDGNGEIAELIALDKRGYFCTDLDLEDDEEEMRILESNFIPILRPLSDLTKPIEHKGERFVPVDELNRMYGYKEMRLVHYVNTGIGWLIEGSIFGAAVSFNNMINPIQKLLEWHFNLIDESEPFINVNNLPENPYK